MRVLAAIIAIYMASTALAFGQADFTTAATNYLGHYQTDSLSVFYSSCRTTNGKTVFVIPWGSNTGRLFDFHNNRVGNIATVIRQKGSFTIDPEATQGGIYTYAVLVNRANELATQPFSLVMPERLLDILSVVPTHVCNAMPPK